jgi:hypothetical protein
MPPASCHFVLRLIDRCLGGYYARTGDADQKRNVLRTDGGERHDPSRLAHAKQSNLRAVDIGACLQVLEGSHHVAGQVVERGRIPVPRRSAHTPFVVPEDRDTAAFRPDEETRRAVVELREHRRAVNVRPLNPVEHPDRAA